MKLHRISESPLLDPSVCALVLMAPASTEFKADLPQWHRRMTEVLLRAAAVADVPFFTLLRRAQPQAGASAGPRATASKRTFVFEEYQCPWSETAFVRALASEDRAQLVFTGFWLEHEILASALQALVGGYDVSVLVDATPARSAGATQSARERLSQAGATPIVTSQLLREWLIATTEPAKRVALQAMLDASVDRSVGQGPPL
jgi:hypothetical protein